MNISFGPWYVVLYELAKFRRKEIAVLLSVGLFVYWILQ